MKLKRCEKITKFIKLKLNIAAIKAQKQPKELSMNSIYGSNVISQHRADQPRTRHQPRHCTNNIFIFVFNKYFIFISKTIIFLWSLEMNRLGAGSARLSLRLGQRQILSQTVSVKLFLKKVLNFGTTEEVHSLDISQILFLVQAYSFWHGTNELRLQMVCICWPRKRSLIDKNLSRLLQEKSWWFDSER